jgi:hypothetical protein
MEAVAQITKLELVRRINRGDQAEIAYWYRKHQEPAVPEERQPEVGYIVPRTAAAWLVETNAGTCLVEGLVTNPDMPSRVRNEAIETLITVLLHEAKARGYRYVYVITKRAEMTARALGRGGQYYGPHLVFGKEI